MVMESTRLKKSCLDLGFISKKGSWYSLNCIVEKKGWFEGMATQLAEAGLITEDMTDELLLKAFTAQGEHRLYEMLIGHPVLVEFLTGLVMEAIDG